jgi:hypothetical protein
MLDASPTEATLERLDPLSAAAARPVTTGAVILALALAVVVVATTADEITNPAWLVVSLWVLVAAVWLLLDRSRVYRPIWRAPSAQVLQLMLVVMTISAALSTMGANERLRDDWAPLVVGIILIALTPYRPAREIALWATVHTLVCAVLGMLHSTSAYPDAPTLVFAVTGSFAVAIMGFGAAAYAHSLNGSLVRWHERAWAAARQAALEERGGVARSVQQQRITTLNRDVVPYLSRAVDAPELTHDDIDEARRLSASIRALLVADIERGWAATLLDELVTRHPHINIAVRADDPDDAASRASLEQRTIVRAIAEVSIRRLAATEIELRVRAPEGRLTVQYTITTPRPDADALRELRGIVELVRGVTERSSVASTQGRITLEFAYGY